MEGLNGNDAGSKRRGISHLDDARLYTATTEELAVLIRGPSNFIKNLNKPAPFNALTIYTSAKNFLEKLKSVLVNHQADYVSKFLYFLNTPMGHTRKLIIASLRMFLAACGCTVVTQGTIKEFARFVLKVFSAKLSKTCRRFPQTPILHIQLRWELGRLLNRFQRLVISAGQVLLRGKR